MLGVPADVDEPQLVVREGGERVDLLDGERWIAPLSDEVHAALTADLARALPGQDVSTLGAGGKSVLRIKLDLRRFESVPGAYALIEAAWSLRRLEMMPHRRIADVLRGGWSRRPVPRPRLRRVPRASRNPSAPGTTRWSGAISERFSQLAAEIAATALPYLAGQPVQCR